MCEVVALFITEYCVADYGVLSAVKDWKYDAEIWNCENAVDEQ